MNGFWSMLSAVDDGILYEIKRVSKDSPSHFNFVSGINPGNEAGNENETNYQFK